MNNSSFLRTLLVAASFALFFSGVQAQVIKTDTIRGSRINSLATALNETEESVIASDEKTIYLKNWFVSLGVGANSISAEGNNKVNNIFDRARVRAQISAGRWFNDYFGVRAQVAIGKVSAYYLAGAIFDKQLNDFNYPQDVLQYIIEKDGIAWYRKKFTYMEYSVAAMTDVVKWFNNSSKWGVQLYAGPTFAHVIKSQGFHKEKTWGAKFGTQIDYKINRSWSVMGDLQANLYNESFDGVAGGVLNESNKTLDLLVAASVGLSYHFSDGLAKTRVDLPITYEDTYIPQPKRIKEVKADAKEIIAPFIVRFLIDKSNIEDGQKPHIEKFAQYLKDNKEAKVMLTGYADKETAYPEYNMRLSKKRVNSVKKYLVENCGISEDRIETNAKGDTERVYEEDFRWNRVVVMTIIEK